MKRHLPLTALIALAWACPGMAQDPCFAGKLHANDPDDDDRFGQAVAISGDVAVSGAFKHDDNGSNSGSAYIHRYDGTAWVFETELVASDGTSQDRFGWSVDIAGPRLAVGAREDDDLGMDSGSAYVFREMAGGWAQEDKLLAQDGQAGDEFGSDVAVSGGTILVGANLEDSGGSDAGAVYAFDISGSNWVQTQKILALDSGDDDMFGTSVAIDGNVAIVGAPLENQGGTAAGAAYVFRRSAGTWSQEQKLASLDLGPNDRFGFDVAVLSDRILVGAFNATAASNDVGAAYVFHYDGMTWSQEAKLEAADGVLADVFGYSVALEIDGAVIGAHLEDDAGSDSGSVYVFARNGTVWTQRSKFSGADTAASDSFGFSVDIDGDHLLVGAWGDDDIDDETGSSYVFDWEPSLGMNYCPSEPTSATSGATIAARGSAVVGDNDFTLVARCAASIEPGIFFFGNTMVDVPFGEGRRCAGGTVLRLNPPILVDSNGGAIRSVNFNAMPAVGNIVSGSGWNFQFWFRDPMGGPVGFNLSDATHVDFQ